MFQCLSVTTDQHRPWSLSESGAVAGLASTLPSGRSNALWMVPRWSSATTRTMDWWRSPSQCQQRRCIDGLLSSKYEGEECSVALGVRLVCDVGAKWRGVVQSGLWVQWFSMYGGSNSKWRVGEAASVAAKIMMF